MAVSAVNPDVKFQPHHLKVRSNNILALIEEYDIIADGSDNFETRFLVNDACHLARKTLVSGAILRFEGQVSTFKSHMGKNYPCYRCLYRSPPPANLVPSCAEGGVIGTLAGTVGSIQGTEVLKEIMGVGTSMSGNLILYNALETEFRKISLKRDTDCPLCGEKPTILDLSIHSET
jgi:adenylyltransferase/sulfurtransferase